MKKISNGINKEWHETHRIPLNAKFEQRIEWHIEHAKYCVCREMPLKILEEIKKRKIKLKWKIRIKN